jgi:hypothetical protein
MKKPLTVISNKATNFFLITNVLQGESSIRRSPHPRKRINYAKIDSSDEERESRKIRRTNNTTNNSELAESPPRTPS